MLKFSLGIDILLNFIYNLITFKLRVIKNKNQERKNMNFQPLGKRVLIEREEEVKTTATGIIIPDNAAKEKPQIGKIVAVGNDEECKNVKVGDTVVFAKYAGSEVSLDDKKYLILNLEDVLGVIK